MYTFLFFLVTLNLAAINAVQLTASDTLFTVSADSAIPFVVAFNRTNCDITSLLFNNREVQYYEKGSHVNSGLDVVDVTAEDITSKLRPFNANV